MSNPLISNAVNVVVVEDDPVVRGLLCDSISAASGLSLNAALATKKAALDWLAAHQPDVLLTDLGLPDGSGIDVIRYCAATHPECDIMVITMFGDEKNVIASIDAGALGYILKDSDEIDVAQFVDDLRNGGSPMSPLVARKLLARHSRGAPAPDQVPREIPVSNEVSLSERELDTLDLIARGYTYAEISKLLGVSVNTVQTHVKHIYSKLSVHSRGEAVFEAHKLGLLRAGLLQPF
ncbi:MAG: response regulator transcription factor [Betaproteobacteria bacterium]|jgi:DNA-binding NarL/FixJ family response regulator|nr:response regulator transcription factor [Betaproteobacteria bacterium]MBP6647357.1 response regulator transcription factor [Burkholderiaceae bacterium]